MRLKLLFTTIAFSALSAVATTWFDDEAKDPISGETTKVQSIGSSGSYIWQWESKYDAVYWPLTAESYIRFNTNSGYIALGSDFEKISTNEITHVKTYLSENYDSKKPPRSHEEKLQWLERIYSQRETDPEFFIRHYCLLSYLNRNDEDKASRFRKVAVEKIEEYLKTAEPSFYRSQLYIVAGFYSELLGDDKAAEQFWSSPKRLEVDEETTEGAMEYLDGILKSIQSGEYKEKYYR